MKQLHTMHFLICATCAWLSPGCMCFCVFSSSSKLYHCQCFYYTHKSQHSKCSFRNVCGVMCSSADLCAQMSAQQLYYIALYMQVSLKSFVVSCSISSVPDVSSYTFGFVSTNKTQICPDVSLKNVQQFSHIQIQKCHLKQWSLV